MKFLQSYFFNNCKIFACTKIYMRTPPKSLLKVVGSIPGYEASYLWGIKFSTWGVRVNN